MSNEEIKKNEEVNKICDTCKMEIPFNASICHHCGYHRNKILNKIKFIVTYIPLVMALVAAVQVILAFSEKIDAGKMLDEVTAIKKKADNTLKDVEGREKILTSKLDIVSNEIDSMKTEFDSNNVKILSEQGELTTSIKETKATAKQEILEVVNSVDQQALESKTRLGTMEKNFNHKQEDLNMELKIIKDGLSAQLQKLEWRDHLQQLTDKAIYEGDRVSYNEISEIRKEPKGSEQYATVESYRLQVKLSYINTERYGNLTFTRDNKEADLSKYSTFELINELLKNPNFVIRSAAAKSLATRKEKGVGTALIKAIKNDTNLYVVAKSSESFVSLTGHERSDVFDEDNNLQKYWDAKREEFEENLKSLD
jgi:hypothetical protein